MNKLLSPRPIWQEQGIALVRILAGCLLIYHGKEIFDAARMKEYAGWPIFKSSSFMPYLGKGAELVAGIMLVLGLFTRIALLITIGTFAYIVFFVGHGKIWTDDQHPFLFIVLALLLFFTGPGALSLDAYLFRKRKPW